MKLGQVLSTRPDLVPPRYESELARLQDAGPIVPPGVLVSEVERAFGRSIREMFASFDAVPIAAASIGEVHAATLHDGRDVVVKVRRPRVIDRVTVDLERLERVASVLATSSSLANRFDPIGLARRVHHNIARRPRLLA